MYESQEGKTFAIKKRDLLQPPDADQLAKGSAASRVQEILARRKVSSQWQQDNWWPRFERTVKAFMQQADPVTTDNSVNSTGVLLYDDYGKPIANPGIGTHDGDPICPPDLYVVARRRAARMNSNIPNLRHRSGDADRARRVSQHLMHQWDRGGGRAAHTRHLLQADIFGFSIKEVGWADQHVHTPANVYPAAMTLEELEAVKRQYTDEINQIVNSLVTDWETSQAQEAELAASAGLSAPVPEIRSVESFEIEAAAVLASQLNGRIPVDMSARGYIGTTYQTKFVGDVYPEPEVLGLHKSAWFCDTEMVTEDWLEDFWRRWHWHKTLSGPLADVLNEAYKNCWGRDKSSTGDSDYDHLRSRIYSVIKRSSPSYDSGSISSTVEYEQSDGRDRRWLLTRIHYPDRRRGATVEYVLNDQYYLGRYPLDFQLTDGKIPFSLMVFNEDLFSMLGDPVLARMAPLQESHASQLNMRMALAGNVLRPLIFTDDPEILDNPYAMKRYAGYRIVKARPGSTQMENQSAAIAAMSAGMANESSYHQMIQGMAGESNLSMQANVDPQQGRTATGSRIMQFNMDVLVKADQVRNEQAIAEEMTIAREINRSELDVQLEIPEPSGDGMIVVTGRDFKEDTGDLHIEAGSMLADADESNVASAGTAWEMALRAPHVVSMETARNKMLTALGEGSRVAEWTPKPMPPPPPPEPRKGYNVSLALSLRDMRESGMSDEMIREIAGTAAAGMLQQQSPPPVPGPMDGGPQDVPPPPPDLANQPVDEALSFEDASAMGLVSGDQGTDDLF